VRPERRQGRRRALIALAVLAATSGAPAATAADRAAAAADVQGTWCWGSQRRSANVPFLRITSRDGALVVETKDYMHDGFAADTRDVAASGDHLDFSYWYTPLARWARCSLTLEPSHDTMAGTCEGEPSARQWGVVPSYLWRC
jgi:hypothetical protein